MNEALDKLGLSYSQLDTAFRRNRLGSPHSFLVKDTVGFRKKIDSKSEKTDRQASQANNAILENVEQFAERVFQRPLVRNTANVITKPSKRIINLVLSDLHFGSDLIAGQDGLVSFGVIEEARRFAFIIAQACEYKPEHRKETELNIFLLGDIIQGQLHDPRDGAILSEQICRAIHLLSQGIFYCSSRFNRINVHCVTGNHGRNLSRHKSRAVHQKYDSYETVIYYAVKSVCVNLKNVTFNIPKLPFVTVDLFGKHLFATHGDSVLSPGYPNRSINTGSLESQLNRLNASLTDRDEYAVAIVGHVHTASMTVLGNGSWMITNGALVPADSYAVSIGIIESACGQWIFESVPGFPVGDSRLIRVDSATDKNQQLDKIIQPWQDY